MEKGSVGSTRPRTLKIGFNRRQHYRHQLLHPILVGQRLQGCLVQRRNRVLMEIEKKPRTGLFCQPQQKAVKNNLDRVEVAGGFAHRRKLR
jgi:hypothetical protein